MAKNRRNRERSGFILVSVMISSALLITAATAFAYFANIQIKKCAARENIFKFRSVAEIAAAQASALIAADTNEYDAVTEELYSRPVLLKFGDYTVTMTITPLNGKIAVKGLFLPDGITMRNEYTEAWENIWSAVGHAELASIACDFMDKDKKQSLGGSERDENINRPVCKLEEFRKIQEVDDKILYGTKELPGLEKFLTTDGTEKININTAAPEVIAILDNTITLAAAQNVAVHCKVSPVKTTDELTAIPGFPAAVATKLKNIIAFKSTHFLLKIKVQNKSGAIRNYRVILEKASKKIVGWQE